MEKNIITLTTNTYTRAFTLKGRLEAEGIECFLSNVNLIQPNVSYGVKVRIFEDDLPRALKILKKTEKEHGSESIDSKKDIYKTDKILVAVDFSDYSLNACIYSLHLAAKLRAKIRLVHAFFNPMIDAMTFPDAFTYQSNMAEVYQELEKKAKAEMKIFIKKLKKYADEYNLGEISITKSLVAGRPYDELTEMTKKYKPGVIILGTRGQGRKPDEMIGSVTSKILESSSVNIPILVVPEDARIEKIDHVNILYATKFDDSDYEAIRKLMAVVSNLDVSFYCVHFSTGESSGKWNEAYMKEIKDYFAKTYRQYKIECSIIESEDVVAGMNNFIREKNIDIISLTHKKRTLLYRLFDPGFAKKLLFMTEKPVLIFHS